MTRRRRLLLLAAVACHLGLAVTGALGLCLWEAGPLGPSLTYYRALSGTDSKYSYYAPSVRAPLRAEFTILDGGGEAVTTRLETGVTREADIRVEDLIQVFGHGRVDEPVRRQVAASLAAAMLARHPGAAAVQLDVVRRGLPTMSALRRGAEIRWQPVFRARIVRSRDVTASAP